MILIDDNYYSGFYELTKKNRPSTIEDLLETISFDDCYLLPSLTEDIDECPYENSTGTIFLHGSCNLFAKALNVVYGYPVYEVSQGSNNHWYCKTTYANKACYIDIRGATTDFVEFSRSHSFIKDPKNPIPREISGTEMTFADEEWKETGMIFAFSIIAEYEGYYGCFLK